LWAETSAVLDIHLLGGRPDRFAPARYHAFYGCNWLRPCRPPPAPKQPSKLVKRALGVPLHDLRTLAGQYLREHDPARAPAIVQALLGHRTRRAGKDHHLECADDAAVRGWFEIRSRIGQSSLHPQSISQGHSSRLDACAYRTSASLGKR
jgi:hypothetical protein